LARWTTQKNWKFSAADIRERAYWNDYMTAYEDDRYTATPEAPWHVIPADNHVVHADRGGGRYCGYAGRLEIGLSKVDDAKPKELRRGAKVARGKK